MTNYRNAARFTLGGIFLFQDSLWLQQMIFDSDIGYLHI